MQATIDPSTVNIIHGAGTPNIAIGLRSFAGGEPVSFCHHSIDSAAFNINTIVPRIDIRPWVRRWDEYAHRPSERTASGDGFSARCVLPHPSAYGRYIHSEHLFG